MKIFSIINQVGVIGFVIAAVKEIYRKTIRETIFGSYAQDYEDLLIEKIINKNKGVYLEIGAYHPSRLSNTYRFYKKGWQGIVVEPNPDVNNLFVSVRPNDQYFNVGIGYKNGILEYYKYDIPALNTFSPEQVEINSRNGFVHNKKQKIKIVKIGDFLKINVRQKIDFLSLDVEGWDKVILENWNWEVKPKVICVESRDVKKILLNQGYKLKYQTVYNSIYVF